MKRRSRKGLVAGLVVGGIVGVAAIMWFAPRSNGQRAGNLLADLHIGDVVAQAEAYLIAAREQVREALNEGQGHLRGDPERADGLAMKLCGPTRIRAPNTDTS